MAKIFLLGKDGKIFGFVLEPKTVLIKEPLLELSTKELLSGPLYQERSLECPSENKIIDIAQGAYQKWGKYSPYGELIVISLFLAATEYFFSVDFIAHRGYPKGILAADLVPIFTDSDGKEFFVGITIGKGKYRGRPALIGGHQDLKGFHFESPLEALVHEGKDEAKIIFQPREEYRKPMERFPFLQEIFVDVEFSGKKYISVLELLRTYRTSDEERFESWGRMRVDLTTAYCLRVNVDFPLTKEIIAENLKAGDDADNLVIVELGVDEAPQFAFAHHAEIFEDAKI